MEFTPCNHSNTKIQKIILLCMFFVSLTQSFCGTEYISALALLCVHIRAIGDKVDDEIDTLTLNRILEVQKLPKEVKDKLFYFIDMSVRDYKAKKAYS